MKLSKLQRTILLLARETGQTSFSRPADVTHAEVKAAYYGFPLRPRGTKIFFDKSEIGHDRYNNASVAVSNACKRLVSRDLAESVPGGGGLWLTEKGWETVARLRNG